MFCEYQEKVIHYEGYVQNGKITITCNKMNKECPYSKLKKAQKKCQYLIPIEEKKDD